MKNILSLIVLVLSLNLNAQNKIETDELFIKYKQEYEKNMDNRHLFKELEVKSQIFYEKIKLDVNRDFYKSKNKEKWLKKNFSRTGFQTIEEVEYAYIELKKLREEAEIRTRVILPIYNELLKKYNRDEIYQAVKDYIWNTNNID